MSRLELEIWGMEPKREEGLPEGWICEQVGIGGDGTYEYSLDKAWRESEDLNTAKYMVFDTWDEDWFDNAYWYDNTEEAIRAGEEISEKFRWVGWTKELDEAMDMYRSRKRTKGEIYDYLCGMIENERSGHERFMSRFCPEDQIKDKKEEYVELMRTRYQKAIDVFAEEYGEWDGPVLTAEKLFSGNPKEKKCEPPKRPDFPNRKS